MYAKMYKTEVVIYFLLAILSGNLCPILQIGNNTEFFK